MELNSANDQLEVNEATKFFNFGYKYLSGKKIS